MPKLRLLLILLFLTLLGYLLSRFLYSPADIFVINDANLNYFVSPSGNDNNPGTENQPFKTIEKARDAVRTHIASGLNKHVKVYLRAGTYELSAPLVFDSRDSGTDQYSIVYRGYPGEIAVISGGRKLPSSWANVGGNLWRLALPNSPSFHMLYKDSLSQTRARFPNLGSYSHITALNTERTQFFLGPTNPDPNAWDPETGAELVTLFNWETARTPILQKAAGSTPIVTTIAPVGTSTSMGSSALTPKKGHTTYLVGSKGLIDVPGEWYFDHTEKALYFMANNGENPNSSHFVAGRLIELIKVEGTASAPVNNLHFNYLDLAYTDYQYLPNGYDGVQSNFFFPDKLSSLAHALPTAVTISHAKNFGLSTVFLQHLGMAGLGIGAGTHGAVIERSTFSDIGGNCLMLGWDKTRSLGAEWPSPTDTPSSLVIRHNTVSTCGRIFEGGIGISANMVRDSEISNNHVYDLPYTGISVLTNWNNNVTSQQNNKIVANHIHDVMKLLSDGGGIYLNGNNPNTLIAKNLIYDVRAALVVTSNPKMNNGIFLDNGIASVTVQENIVYSSSGDALRWNPWPSTAEANTVNNNFFNVTPGSANYPTSIANAARPSLPPTPTNPQGVCAPDGKSANLTWQASPASTRYAFRLNDQSNGWGASCDNPEPGDICTTLSTTGSYTVTTTPGHTYNWWVHACHATGCTEAVGGSFTCGGNQSNPSLTPSTSPSSPPASPIGGDLNNDQRVDIYDYNLLVRNFGNPYTIYDYNILVQNFGR